MTGPRTSYEFACELSEKQIEADFASFLGHVSESLGDLRLLDVNEQITGADKRLNWNAVAYFFQFKKPVALRPLLAPARRPKREDKRQAIRRFRYENSLEQSPFSICFQLRKPAKSTPSIFQHNVLMSLEAPPNTRALYVCPLVYSAKNYLAALREDEFPWFYFEPRGRWLLDGGHAVLASETSSYLRAHAAITPHAKVTDWRHYYSFSPQATDIAFHSPEVVAAGPMRLSDYAASEVRRLRHPEAWATVATLAESLTERGRQWGIEPTAEREDEHPLEKLYLFGKRLRERFGIRQVTFLRRLPESAGA